MTHMHLPVCGNFKDEHVNTKPTTVKIHHKHMKYVYKWDRMEIAMRWTAVLSNEWKNCSFICLTWPLRTAWFYHQLQKPICQRNCHLCLVRNLTDKAGKLRHLHLLTKGRPSNAAKTVDHHTLTNSDHWLVWPVLGNRLKYCAHSAQRVHSQTAYRLYEIWSGTVHSPQE
jgi:hypothetical protein